MRVREVGAGDVPVADPRADPVRVDDQDQQVVGDAPVVPVRDVCDLRGLGRVRKPSSASVLPIVEVRYSPSSRARSQSAAVAMW